MPFQGAPFDRIVTFFEEYNDIDKSLAGQSLKEIHKLTLIAVIEDDKTGTNYKEASLKHQLMILPLSLQIKILESIIPACKLCRQCFEGHPKLDSIDNCPIEKYLFWMKTEATLSTSEKSCRARMDEHFPIFLRGLHEDIDVLSDNFV